MKEQIKRIVADSPDRLRTRNLVREYLHALVLQAVQEGGFFRTWIFHGGTALRFLYGLPRYSEDLDFALAVGSAVDFASAVAKIRRFMEAEAYDVDVSVKETRVVRSAFLRFPGLLHELGLTPQRTESLSIKIELDANPPAGGRTDETIVRRFVLLNIFHYDKASLLSGKLHAVFARPYVKGRDLFDLFWYLSDRDWPGPNFEFLNNALRQTGWQGEPATPENWKGLIESKIAAVDWRRASDDVRPFIERPGDLRMMTRENFLGLLKSR